jgi:hypothetical protein
MPGKGMSLLDKEELRNVPPIENIMNNDKDEISEILCSIAHFLSYVVDGPLILENKLCRLMN